MNATNRGVLRGLSLSLVSIRDILEAMSDAEAVKEDGSDGQPGLYNRFEGTATDLEEAAMSIDLAIRILQYVVPDKADFEDYIEGAKVPNEPPETEYYKGLYE